MTLIERLIAPQATRAEVCLGFGAAIGGAATASALAVAAEWSWIAVVVVVLIAFDVFGGAVVNAMASAKRWYHRPGRTWVHHLGFVAVHVQPFILAAVVPGFGWLVAAVIYTVALGGAVIVTVAPEPLRRPIAFAATAFGLVVVTSLITVPQELLWFAPVLLIKLLLAHLLPEGAARPELRTSSTGAAVA
ncbi:hypothetical protein GV794_24640 [Nocardia cyriacigeorgica]|uniref:Uncharacterized protein n=1 Tax=Nocardia cyriacigeorgica TaxID=135487 RepID=A0A6P1D7A7_9NOCA|nr:hypothetical protein [Nocardia cyriacigeorgica]NEW38666.1 hypothetical protein [Nocardia cyriacigeorgica]NEW46526.1 hypothetical protein [Nocardia cyriacigeorgica]NEW53426.1 hypothetical protein [Nocardia cyriacigeorgica]NEW58800.1 hypothetical protein [Nocardia cyriacigeorgica]